MTIVKKNESMPIQSVLGMIYAEPGIGKTTLACSAEKPLLVDFDRGSNIQFRGDSVQITNWSEVEIDLWSAIEAGGYKTVIFDTVDSMLTMLLDHIQENEKDKNKLRDLRQKYLLAGPIMTRLIDKYKRSGIDTIFIAHTEEKEKAGVTQIRPMVTGKIGRQFLNKCDYISYLYMTRESETSSNMARVLSFNPTEEHYAKNRGGVADVLIPTFTSAGVNDAMAKILTKIKYNMNTFHESHLEIVNKVELYKTEINGLTAETINEWYNKEYKEIINSEEKIVTEQIKNHLKQHSNKLEMKYDPKSQKFIVTDTKQGQDAGT